MRTNIEIDESLMAKARHIRPDATKRAIVEEGLALLVRLHDQQAVRSLRGQLAWDGDLESMRRDS